MESVSLLDGLVLGEQLWRTSHRYTQLRTLEALGSKRWGINLGLRHLPRPRRGLGRWRSPN